MGSVRLCPSSSIRRSGNEGIEKRFGDFEQIGFFPRSSKSRISRPQVSAHPRQRSGARRSGFGIPGSLARGSGWGSRVEGMSDQPDPVEQAQRPRGRAGNGFVRPRTVGFHAQVAASRCQGDFQLPTLDKPGDEGQRFSGRVGREHRRGASSACGSGISPQRLGSAGLSMGNPTPPAEAICLRHPGRSYQGKVVVVPVVSGVFKTCASGGTRLPFLPGRPWPL
jgi:hypothetical protein